ncbi:MAG: NAD-binding protein [Alphaproteobacteria bacterium]|nr:NAD-binding protein [Alphaproteobacteria bacterium]
MIIGSIKEQNPDETRVSLTPEVIKKLVSQGHSIWVERDLGTRAGWDNKEYTAAGANIVNSPLQIIQKSQTIIQIAPPTPEIIEKTTPHQLLITYFEHQDNTTLKSQTIHLERVPRTSVAQSIDILSSQNTVRGYMAAIYTLYHATRIAPQLMTAATSIKAATALVIGASITGLQAASVLKKIGCHVTMLDINKEAEQLAKSVGATFVTADTSQDIINIIKNKDFIIGAASTSNKSAPKILTHQQLENIITHPIIIDTTDANIEGQQSSPLYSFYRNLHFERFAPKTASTLWANNILNLLNLIYNSKKFDFSLDYIKTIYEKPY